MTDELKALLKAAKTEEEAKEILLAHKNELTEEEQEKISGGTWTEGFKFVDGAAQADGPLWYHLVGFNNCIIFQH